MMNFENINQPSLNCPERCDGHYEQRVFDDEKKKGKGKDKGRSEYEAGIFMPSLN